MNIQKRLFFCAILSLLMSCTVGPDYVKPPVKLPTSFKEKKGDAFISDNPKQWKVAQPRDIAHRSAWWKVFDDPQLNALEDELNCRNQTIINAIANYQQSYAIVSEARAAYFPTLTGAFNFFRQKSGGGSTSFISTSNGTTTSGTAATGATSSSTTISNSYSAFLSANWEPDIWGLVQRTVESNLAAAQANQALIAATRLSAQGSLAQYYFELRALDTDQQLLDNTVIAYQKTLQLTRNQYASGVASQADILQAQTQLEMAEGQAINNGILRSQYEHAIAVLIGRIPSTFSITFKPLKTPPPVIPVTVPSEWLERRPDIAQAERLMQQANAQIGIAVAAYYPSLNLSGSGSGAANTLGRLLTYPSIGWAIGLQIAETIYDGGLREATVRAASAGYMAQVANYRQTILTAFQNVEDNLVALRLLKQESVVENQAAAHARKALQLVINQYKAGTVPYSSVITAQIAAYSAEKTAADVVGLEMSTAVGLIKALGGGWKACSVQSCN